MVRSPIPTASMDSIPVFLVPWMMKQPATSQLLSATRTHSAAYYTFRRRPPVSRSVHIHARRRPTYHPVPRFITHLTQHQSRTLHAKRAPPSIPDPIPFCPTPQTFLTLIGRNLSTHSSKFPTWPSLFTPDGKKLRQMGLEPARDRRYLMHWREKFRRGEWGVGGDLKFVSAVGEDEAQRVAKVVLSGVKTDGAAEVEKKLLGAPGLKASKKAKQKQGQSPVQKLSAAELGVMARVKQVIANVPLEWEKDQPLPMVEGRILKPAQLKMNVSKTSIRGPGIEIVDGTQGRVVLVKTREGLWEHKRGKKVDGGERRRDEVRAKRRIEANKEK